MTWVCGAGTGIGLPNLTIHHRQSSPFSKATYPLQIHCKKSNTVINPSCSPCVQPISSVSRRQLAAIPLLGLSLVLNFSHPAHAQDIPFFGIKKLKKVEEEVIKEARELVIEGEKGAEKVAEEVKEIAQDLESEASVLQGPGAAVQAGLVAGAELVGVLVATSVVNSIVGPEPSKLGSQKVEDLVYVHNNLRLVSRGGDEYKCGPHKEWDVEPENTDIDLSLAALDIGGLASSSTSAPSVEHTATGSRSTEQASCSIFSDDDD